MWNVLVYMLRKRLLRFSWFESMHLRLFQPCVDLPPLPTTVINYPLSRYYH